MMWSFERFGDRTALVDEHGASLTYRQLKREADALCAAAGGRCLTFNLCRNTLGSLLGYAGFVEGGVVPALLAAYAYGPVSGIAVCLIKNLIKLPSTSTAAVGELFNFVMGALFVGVAGFVYKRSKTRRSALIGAGLGALIMAVVSVPYNYFIVYPAYVVLYHLPLEAIIGMYQAINPSVDGLLTCLITFNFPFTLFKGLLDAALCFLIYKPLSGVLHGRK